jgi:hypothetical protein
VGHVTCIGQKYIHNIGEGNLKGRDYLEDPVVDRRITLKFTLKIQNARAWTGLGSGYRQVVGCCEHDNEPAVSIK